MLTHPPPRSARALLDRGRGRSASPPYPKFRQENSYIIINNRLTHRKCPGRDALRTHYAVRFSPRSTAQSKRKSTSARLASKCNHHLSKFHKAKYVNILHMQNICILIHGLCKISAQTAPKERFAPCLTFILYYAPCTICRTHHRTKCRTYILYLLRLSNDMRKSMDASGGHKSHARSASSASSSSVGCSSPRSAANRKAQ